MGIDKVPVFPDLLVDLILEADFLVLRGVSLVIESEKVEVRPRVNFVTEAMLTPEV